MVGFTRSLIIRDRKRTRFSDDIDIYIYKLVKNVMQVKVIDDRAIQLRACVIFLKLVFVDHLVCFQNLNRGDSTKASQICKIIR